jgi:hypothetical protein
MEKSFDVVSACVEELQEDELVRSKSFLSYGGDAAPRWAADSLVLLMLGGAVDLLRVFCAGGDNGARTGQHVPCCTQVKSGQSCVSVTEITALCKAVVSSGVFMCNKNLFWSCVIRCAESPLYGFFLCLNTYFAALWCVTRLREHVYGCAEV